MKIQMTKGREMIRPALQNTNFFSIKKLVELMTCITESLTLAIVGSQFYASLQYKRYF